MSKVSVWPIAGHEIAVNYLQSNITQGDLAHAYLFIGPAHVGKTAVANCFAYDVTAAYSSYIPPRTTDIREFYKTGHADAVWLERPVDEKTGKRKQAISVEQVRAVLNRLKLHAFHGGYKLAVIEQAETLSLEAANALLKTLEEPTPKTIIILTATHRDRLPKTILSRCRVIEFFPVAERTIAEFLTHQGVAEKSARELAALAQARPGVALDYTQSGDFEAVIGQVRGQLELVGRPIYERLLAAESVLKQSTDEQIQTLATWETLWRDVLLTKYQQPLITYHRLAPEVKTFSLTRTSQQLLSGLREIAGAKTMLRANGNPKLIFENLLLVL